MKNILSKLKEGFSKEKFSVGLDIGTQATKIAKLRSTKEGFELCGFAIEPTGAELPQVLGKIKELGLGNSVNISISGAQTVIRYAYFPKMNAYELRQALKFEAQKHIPFSISEVNLDGCILKDNLPDNKMLVLIAAAKKEFVTARLKAIEEAGFAVNMIEIDSVALVNAYTFANPSQDPEGHKAVALLNIGASVSNLNILEENLPRLSRDIHIGGNNFTHKIMDIYGLDFKNADNLKNDPGSDPEKTNKINAAVESALLPLATEIRTSFDYYESQNASSVKRIYLSGGGIKFGGLKEMLMRLVGIEVEYWDPLGRIQLSETIDLEKAKAASGQLAIALGLALHS